MVEVYPELADTRIDYCWGGMVDMTRDRLPRAGERDGIYLLDGLQRPRHADVDADGHASWPTSWTGTPTCNPWKDFDWPAIPGYFGRPWFLPIVGAYYRMKDLVG